jgi:DNA-directed RNA polymerase subunit H (RpoH/RPB5)
MIEQDQFLTHAIIENIELREILQELSLNPKLLDISKTDPEWKVLGWFSDE